MHPGRSDGVAVRTFAVPWPTFELPQAAKAPDGGWLAMGVVHCGTEPVLNLNELSSFSLTSSVGVGCAFGSVSSRVELCTNSEPLWKSFFGTFLGVNLKSMVETFA